MEVGRLFLQFFHKLNWSIEFLFVNKFIVRNVIKMPEVTHFSEWVLFYHLDCVRKIPYVTWGTVSRLVDVVENLDAFFCRRKNSRVTVWKIKNFSVTQILREFKLGNYFKYRLWILIFYLKTEKLLNFHTLWRTFFTQKMRLTFFNLFCSFSLLVL